jgi:hypothetical protein
MTNRFGIPSCFFRFVLVLGLYVLDRHSVHGTPLRTRGIASTAEENAELVDAVMAQDGEMIQLTASKAGSRRNAIVETFLPTLNDRIHPARRGNSRKIFTSVRQNYKTFW